MGQPCLPSEGCCSRGTADWITCALPAMLLFVHAALLLHAAPHQAPIVDEIWHLPAGVSYWERGEFWCYHHNPPLMRWLYSLPAVLAGVDVDYSRYVYRPMSRQADFEFGRDFMAANRDHYLFLFAVCRPIVIATSVACGWLIWRWSKSLFGPAGGLVSLWLWVFFPESLTHSMFLTTDVGAAFFGFLATWFFWQYLRAPSTRRAVYSGIALGLAEGVKYSCIILPFSWIILAALRCLPCFAASNRLPSKRRFLFDAATVLLTSVVTLNNLYLFDGFGRPLGDFPFYSRTLTVDPDFGQHENRFQNTWLGQLCLPFPEQYILGFDAQLADLDHGDFQKFLGGTLKKGDGWWYYYLCASVVKLPLGVLVVLCLAAIVSVVTVCNFGRQRTARGISQVDKTPSANASAESVMPPGARAESSGTLSDRLVLLVPAILYFISVSSNTGLQYFRYLLPTFPFVFVLCGCLGRYLVGDRRWQRVGLWLVLLSIPASVLRYHPYYLPYFNEVAGGAEAGPRYLGDSSVDWGEGLLALRDWLRDNRPNEPLHLAYFGTIAPSVVGLDPVGLPPFGPADESESDASEPESIMGPVPGLQAVSVSYVQGISFPTPNENLRDVILIPSGVYRYYSRFRPIAKPAYSIWVFDLSIDDVNRVRKEMGLPAWRDGDSSTASAAR